MDRVVLHSLEKEPERRYQHASEVKSDVEVISSEPNIPMKYPPGAAASVRPRFSRAAIVGACWASSFLLLPFLLVLHFTSTFTEAVSAPGVPIDVVGTLLKIGPLVLLTMTSVFGTTILGFVAISHIRHSAGRLYGMGLALFDALLYPLLVLDAVIIAFCLFLFGIYDVIPPVVLPLPGVFRLGFALLIAGIICIIIDIFIVRWSWRKANKGLIPIQPDGAFNVACQITTPAQDQQQYPYTQTGVNMGAVQVGPCGGSVQSGAAFGGFPQVNPMEKHITLVAVLNIVFGTLGMLIGITTLAAISGGGLISRDPTAMKITGIVGPAVGFFFFLTSLPEVIGGIGLLKRRGWARILVMIISILDLLAIPIGTAIAIYTLWVLLNEKTAQLFAQASAARMKEPTIQEKKE